MKHIQYTIKDNEVYIEGTNQIKDLLTSAQCWPNREGFHTGAMKKAYLLFDEILPKLDGDKIVVVKGYSMGGAIAQCLSYLLKCYGFDVKCYTKGSYPVTRKDINFDGYSRIYGNDPVPALFPWFKHVVRKTYEGPKRWLPIIFPDHLKYGEL